MRKADGFAVRDLRSWTATDEDVKTLRAHFAAIARERSGAAKAVSAFAGYVESVEREAELALRDMARLPGNPEKSFIGNPPSWLERRYNDNEYLWQMNRMHHWSWMCFGYALSCDEKYAKKVCSELLDWVGTVPADYDILKKVDVAWFSACHPMRVLEAGIRLHRTWPHIVNFLSSSLAFTDEVVKALAESVHYQASVLRVVSPAVWPLANHNHFIMEMLGLLTAALYFPVFPEAEEWKIFALKSLERAARAQLTEDGGQIEGCPSYHDGCMFWFGLPLVFEKRFGIQMSGEYKRLYRKSLGYSLYAMRPTGTSVPVGDSHASHRAVISGMYAYECFGDPSILESLRLYMKQETMEKVMEEHVWYLSDTEKVLRFASSLKARTPELPTVFFNPVLGQGVVKSDWSAKGHSALLTCRSPVYDSHAHIDLNSFDYCALGKTIVSDPGYYCYREDDDRRFFKTTGCHSTIKVDGRDQFEYLGSWKFGPQGSGKILEVKEGRRFKGITGWHDCYKPLEHLRHLILADGGFLVVADVVERGRGRHVRSNFHFDYADMRVDGPCAYGENAKVAVEMRVCPERGLFLAPGRLSDKNDTARPSTMVFFEYEPESERDERIVVIAPYEAGGAKPDIRISKTGGGYLLKVGGRTCLLALDGKTYSFKRV